MQSVLVLVGVDGFAVLLLSITVVLSAMHGVSMKDISDSVIT